MRIFLSFLPIIIAAFAIGFGGILIIHDEIRHSKPDEKNNI